MTTQRRARTIKRDERAGDGRGGGGGGGGTFAARQCAIAHAGARVQRGLRLKRRRWSRQYVAVPSLLACQVCQHIHKQTL